MQSSVPVVLPTQIAAAPQIAKPSPSLTDLGDEFMKLLAAIAPTGTISVTVARTAAGTPSSFTNEANTEPLPAPATDTSLPISPSTKTAILASAGNPASALTAVMPEAAEPQTTPLPADQAEAALVSPPPPPAIEAPEPELPKTGPTSHSTTGRSHAATKVRRDTDAANTASEGQVEALQPALPSSVAIPTAAPPPQLPPNATAGRSRAAATVRRDTETADTASTGVVEALQPALPSSVAMPAGAPPPPQPPADAPPQQQPPAANAPKDAAAQQTSPAAALPLSNAQEKPLALPTDATQPTASIPVPPVHQQPAVDADAKPEPVTAPAASIVPLPTLPATSVQTPTILTSATGTPHPTPAAQIAPALVSMSHAPDGAQRLTMKLEPPELGQVHIRIDRPIDATPARVEITVERPETLQLLLRDQPQLQRALDQAGVPAEGRSVTFHVTTPEPAARTETAMAPTPAGSSAAMGGDLSHSASRDGGRPMQPEAGTGASGATDDNEDLGAIAITPTRWLRAGLDITA